MHGGGRAVRAVTQGTSAQREHTSGSAIAHRRRAAVVLANLEYLRGFDEGLSLGINVVCEGTNGTNAREFCRKMRKLQHETTYFITFLSTF